MPQPFEDHHPSLAERGLGRDPHCIVKPSGSNCHGTETLRRDRRRLAERRIRQPEPPRFRETFHMPPPRHHHRFAAHQHGLARIFVVMLLLHVFLIGAVVLYNVVTPHPGDDLSRNISLRLVEPGRWLAWFAAPVFHVTLWSVLGIILSLACFLPGISAALGMRHALGLPASALLVSQSACLIGGEPAWRAFTSGFGLALATGWLGGWLTVNGLLRYRGFRRAYHAVVHHLPLSLGILVAALWSESRTQHLVVQASGLLSGMVYAWVVIFLRIRLLRKNPERLAAIFPAALALGGPRPLVPG